MGHHRAVLVAGRPAIATEPLVEDGQRHPIRPLVEPGDGRFRERGGADRATCREGGLGRPGEQLGRGCRVGRTALGDRPIVELEGELQVGQRVAGIVDRLGQTGRLDGRDPGRTGLVCGEVVTSSRSRPLAEPRRQGRVMTTTLRRQEVRLDRPGDQLVAEPDRGIGRQGGRIAWGQHGRLARESRAVPRGRRSRAGGRSQVDADEAVLDGLDQADRQVGLEDAAAAPRGAARARRRSIRTALEGRRGGRQLVDPERLAGRGQESQDAPALRRALGQAGHRQLLERAGQRRAGQLAAGGQELLGDERIAARPLGHEEQDRGRRTLALDPLDQLGQLVPVERSDVELDRRVRAVGHLGQRRAERVAAGQLVRLVGGQDAQAAGARHPGQERGQGAGPRVGRLEVLEGDHHRDPLADPVEHPQDRLEHPGLTALGLGHRRSRREQTQATEPADHSGQQLGQLLGAGPRHPRQFGVGQARDQPLEAFRDRRVRVAGAAVGRDNGRRGAARAGARSVARPRRADGWHRARRCPRSGASTSGRRPPPRACRRAGQAHAPCRRTARSRTSRA